jgi:hypothetical protein
MANAHENIDNEIVANTLQQILKTGRGESMDLLYKALTKSGDPRYIHRNVQGLPTEGREEWSGNMLLNELKQNPTFGDTLSYKEGKERLAPQESISSKLLKALGIYKGGGEIIKPREIRRGYDLPDVHHGYIEDGGYKEYLQSGGAFIEEGVRDILSGRTGTDDEFSNIGDIISWIEELQSWKEPQKHEPPRMQPMEKGKGLMALLQRLIQGGKTGYKE